MSGPSAAGADGADRAEDGIEATEWSAVRSLLPSDRDLVGADVVDLGCSEGAFCRWVLERGAGSVLGLDLSEPMLERARSASGLDVLDPETPEGPLHYELSDLEQVTLRYASYDLVHCARVLPLLEDPLRLFRIVNAGLRPGGRLVATFNHPVLTAPGTPEFVTLAGRRVWPLDRYAEEGPRRLADPPPGGVPTPQTTRQPTRHRTQHRTLGTTLTALARAGLVLRELVEWAPSGERDRPALVILTAVKPWPGTVPR